MNKVLFAFPENELLAEAIAANINCVTGQFILRHFPDGETYIRVVTDVAEKEAVIVCTLHEPDDKILPLFFLCRNLKNLGAKKITLIAPYLSYMRQDKAFNPGEAITSNYFAGLVSSFADELITVDPHLHRRHSMSEVYSIPCTVLHSSPLISKYIREQIKNPLLIGPDSESEQWVSEVAKNAGTPFVILEKERKSDKDVVITMPQIEKYTNYTPVLIDDIISTAHTMIETIKHLRSANMKPAVCIGVHAVFARNAFEELKGSGAAEIITCNTIKHITNGIDISSLIVNSIK